ncbi:hypothetical protein IRJ34_09350 [Paenarthrobacter sp. GOM3]|uniref:hypothetical protein n=1 Tax=Paenarthrobacter sp. GOM3 TaxID=2782567 RepID=UPI001BAB39AF|nr:hypothetical protein [Paenarthrobacter sp. GOM3]WOH20503.1 hypothetical protein IRJ34_09350 [Paenarthrobacter sp. GOM3]
MRTQIPGPALPSSALAVHRVEGFIQPAKLADLDPGTLVRALRDGAVCHAGPVTDISSEQGLLWIFDEQSRTRKIIETHEFTIVARLETDTATEEPKEQP